MAKKAKAPGAYYYYAGKKIKLAPAHGMFVVDGSDVGQELTDGLRLVTAAQLKDHAADGKKFPVFKLDDSFVVAMPEVRVEESRPKQLAILHKWLTAHKKVVEVVSRSGDRVVLKPVSGFGGDALAIANGLTEEVGPEMAQPRFVRLAPRPGVYTESR